MIWFDTYSDKFLCIKRRNDIQRKSKSNISTMEQSYLASLTNASRQISIYLNIVNVALGIPGTLLNIIVFLSLKTFRENTCAFYLTVMSFLNVSHLVAGSLTRLVFSTFEIDWVTASVSFCKFRTYLTEWSSLTSLTCLCLATIDQYFATNHRVYWQQFSNIKLAHRLTAITIIFWSIYTIPYAIIYNISISSVTKTASCASSNIIFYRYTSHFHRVILTGFLPNCLTALFAYLTYHNIKDLAYRTVPLIRRELDKQLSNMLLVQVIYNICSLVFFNIVSFIVPYVITSNDPIVIAKIQLVQTLSLSIYYSYSAVSNLWKFKWICTYQSTVDF